MSQNSQIKEDLALLGIRAPKYINGLNGQTSAEILQVGIIGSFLS
jgi:hypothetical protein